MKANGYNEYWGVEAGGLLDFQERGEKDVTMKKRDSWGLVTQFYSLFLATAGLHPPSTHGECVVS